MSTFTNSTSPAITVNEASLLHRETSPASVPGSRSNSRSRSLSPSTSPPHLPLGAVASAISPRASRNFSTASRPSPVVPSVPNSPSLSRPTSPKPPRDKVGGSALADEPASPTQDASSLSASNSALDLTHIFERDVEFASSHHLSGSEAVDVAIPPVLTEAAVALSGSDELTSFELASIVRDSEDLGSGWNSPALPVPGAPSHTNHHSYANASRSPVRGGGQRSFSPESLRSGRATSPGSTASLSVSTPGNSPPSASSGLHSFTHHLSEALLESTATTGSDSKHRSLSSPPSAKVHSAGIAFPSSSSSSPADLAPALVTSPSVDSLHDPRRLSFMSLADVINEERLAELTGAPVGGGPSTPSRAVSVGVSDLDDILSKLP